MTDKFPERKYDNAQRAAIFAAKFERGLSYKRISALASEGALDCDAFTIGWDYVGRLCRQESRRRLGKAPSAVAALPAADAVEHMRQRLVALVDSELVAATRERDGQRDPKRLSDLARVIRDIAAIPGLKDARPDKAAGSNTAGQPRTADAPRSGPVGALLATFREQAQNDESPHEAGSPNGVDG